MSRLSDAIGRAVIADAEVEEAGELEAAQHLAVISASARAESEAGALLHRSVRAARAAGVSWALVGTELGMSRQAAQQRFGAGTESEAGDSERWLGPVTAFDEMAELEIAGRAGWRTVEAGMLAHRMVRTDTQWEHRRILWRATLQSERAEGWQVGCRAFPWIYLVRDRGLVPERVPGLDAAS